MKKIIFAITLALFISTVTSCDKEGAENGTSARSIIGCWVGGWDGETTYFEWYIEFKNAGMATKYSADNDGWGTFNNGVLAGKWVVNRDFEYTLNDGFLTFWGNRYPFEMVDKDTFCLTDNRDKIYFYRVKKFIQ